MQSDTSPVGLRGFLIDAPQFGTLRGRPNGAVLIDNGKISKIGDYDDLRRLHPNSIRWLDRRPAAIFPGLIDCHTHLPQYSVVARGESELLPWLRQHIFPVEREFTGPKARAEAPALFEAYLQTHLAESREELEKVHHLYMSARDYTHVYEKCGMLTPHTVVGHCIHLNPREIAAIAAAQSSVAHCPSSNLFLGSGLMKLDQLLKAGINVGLGSDVAGGPELNMWQVMRAAIEVQKARSAYEPNLRPLRPSEAFYLATLGGARALGKAHIIGSLDSGKEADLIVVDLAALLPYPNEDALAELTPEDVVALCIYRGGPQANLETYVRGKCIYQALSPAGPL